MQETDTKELNVTECSQHDVNSRERRNGMENILFSPPLQDAVALRML